jgi:hypothetical protein
MLVPGPLLLYAFPATPGPQPALDNTAAVAGLASAMTSLTKRAVQHIRAAADLQLQPAALLAAASDEAPGAAAYFPAAAASMTIDCVSKPACLLTDWFNSAEAAAAGAGNAGGSSSSSSGGSSSSQASSSAALLAVMCARSLVQVADAVDAVGPRVYLVSVLGKPVFRMRYLNDPAIAGEACFNRQIVYDEEYLPNAEVQWQVWQLAVLRAVQDLWAALKSIGIAQASAAAAATVAAASAGSTNANPAEGSTSSSINSISTSSSNGAGQQVKWGYLLCLQQCSPDWAAAVAAYEANEPDWDEVEDGWFPDTAQLR